MFRGFKNLVQLKILVVFSNLIRTTMDLQTFQQLFEKREFEKLMTHLQKIQPDQLKFKDRATVDGLPMLHYFARVQLKAEDEPLLDEIIKILIASGYDVNQVTDSYTARKRASLGFTALLAAVEQSNLSLVSSLLKNGAKTDICDKRGYYPCHWAVIVGDMKCFEKLVQFGAPLAPPPPVSSDPEFRSDVHPILHTAVDEGRTEMVYYLLEKELVDVNEEAIYRGVLSEKSFAQFPSRYNNSPESPLETVDMAFTPLGRAVRMRKIPIIEVLLKSKKIKRPGLGDLHFCIVEGDTEVACLLKSYYPDEELANDKIHGKWALHCLHRLAYQDEIRVEKTIELIKEYLDAEWDVNAFSTSSVILPISHFTVKDGFEVEIHLVDCTLLHMACMHRSHVIIKYLVEEEHADLNVRTKGDAELTPLQISIFLEEWDIAMHLITMGADLTAVANFKDTYLFSKFMRRSGSGSESTLSRLTSFTTAELLLRFGSKNGLPVLSKMLEKLQSSSWQGSNEFLMAVEGLNPEYVLKILGHSDIMSKICKEDLTWITMQTRRESDQLIKTERVPSLSWLLVKLLHEKVQGLDIRALSELMKLMVLHGYDCNLVGEASRDPRTRTPAPTLSDHLIFSLLTLDFEQETNLLLLKTLLGFGHVQLNVEKAQGRGGLNPAEFVMSLWNEKCSNRSALTQCWKTKSDDCYKTVKLLVTHGLDVTGMLIGNRFQYHFGYKPVVQLLYSCGAKLDDEFFSGESICHKGYLGTQEFGKEIAEIKEWKKRIDMENENGLSFRYICRMKLRKMLNRIRDLERLEVLPKDVKDELLGYVLYK